MSRLTPPRGGTDILAGIAAAAAFLAMVFLLRMDLGLSVLLAAGVYLGVWLVSRAGRPAPEASETEAELIAQIRRLAPSISHPRVQGRIEQICEQAGVILAFLEQHPEKAAAWRGILRDCLQSTRRIVRRSAELSRFLDDPARQFPQDVEALLDQVSTTFANLRRRLVDEGAADLSAEMELFRGTLQALDEVNILNQGGGTP